MRILTALQHASGMKYRRFLFFFKFAISLIRRYNGPKEKKKKIQNEHLPFMYSNVKTDKQHYAIAIDLSF